MILGHMKKILHNFQRNPPSKMRKQDDRTLKTASCEITLGTLRRVSVAIALSIHINDGETICNLSLLCGGTTIDRTEQ